jgi:predicted unusual protein kinase regulating ubiquinone biosynthesis (AarF/ABC1/UbiB family)
VHRTTAAACASLAHRACRAVARSAARSHRASIATVSPLHGPTTPRCVQILANIGEDILVAAADKPFRFPAEFTFVVRSFTVLDGIGKALSPRFDISEISAPYARELILDGRPVLSRLQERVAKGVRRQNQAVKGLFDGPIKIQQISDALERCVQQLLTLD